jgi:hypothetical protein
MAIKVEEFEDVEETLARLRRGIDGAARHELDDDPYKRVQYQALARHLAGAIAIVHVIEGTSQQVSEEEMASPGIPNGVLVDSGD